MTDPTFRPKLPEIAPVEQTPLVPSLLAIIAQQQVQIEQLKGTPRKPTIKPSKMDQEAGREGNQATEESEKCRRGRPQRQKTVELTIHEKRIIPAEGVATGAQFKGYKTFVVRDLVIRAHNTCYYLEQWQRAEGGYLTASLPAVLHAGMAVSDYLQTDDTGARHGGKTGYCTDIGNELFAWFASTESTSRKLPLHNNLSERDIREHVKKRKISGGTRSDLGRQCRDTFSLKKTCRKHGISFWAYLKDRLSGTNTIPPLPDYIRQAAQTNP